MEGSSIVKKVINSQRGIWRFLGILLPFSSHLELLIYKFMWKQIGTKTPLSDRSLSNASSDRKYKRIRPYQGSPLDSPVLSPLDTHDVRRPMSPQLALQPYVLFRSLRHRRIQIMITWQLLIA